jgi:hypothetical protein
MSEFDRQTGILYDPAFQEFDAQADQPGRDLIYNSNAIYRFNSYSGCDISAIVHFYDENAAYANRHRSKKLADLQTLTISTFREKVPVRALGHVGSKGYTRGPRTVGGSMIFTIFDKTVLAELLVEKYQLEAAAQDNVGVYNAVLVDQIPPFDITVLMANETGSMSKLAIYGVELVQEGQTMSVEDLVSESVVNYVARHFEPLESLVDPLDPEQQYLNEGKDHFPDMDFRNMMENKTLYKFLASLR